ncbi:MAG TPA: amidohydrolase family protein [Armatimonadaceae bacterium]|nr:amidohydrolase family protein [Armatimonadaceae bacterium]
MKTPRIPLILALLLSFPALAARAQTLAVRGETVYTMAGGPLKDGVVLVKDGKIEKVGPAAQVPVPEGYRTLTAKVVTPGLIDAHTVVGLSGYLNQPQDQNQLEGSAPVQPELRALDAYDARERLIEWLRGFGVTTLNTGHAPGALVPGQTMLVKTLGDTVEAVVVRPTSAICVTLGEGGVARGGSPGTRAKTVAVLRAELLRAQDYAAKQQPAKSDDARDAKGGKDGKPAAAAPTPPARDLKMEALAGALRGEVPLLVTAHRATDIANALRVAKEFPTLRVILDGASEAYLMVSEIRAAGVPVVLHPTMMRADGEAENLSMETAATLRRAGIPVALQSGFEGYVPKTRVVLFEAAVAAAYGLSFEEALATITRDAAKILGVDDRVGTLEAGKDADLALYDGDPFEYTTHCTGTVVNGRVASEVVR